MKHKPWEVEDGLWERIEPLLPVVKRRYRYPGRKRLDQRRAMCGIRWEFLPQELGFGSGMTCWRRLRDWKEAGVWQQLHELLLAELRAGDALDLSRASVDGSHLRVLKGGDATGPSSVDRGKTGSKHHVIVDVHGMPLAATVTGGNRNDVTQRLPLIHAVPPIRVRELGIRPLIARRGTGHGSGLGKNRWVVEAAFALLRWFCRLRIRWEIRADIHHAFLTLGCAIICWRRLKKQC
ncbi:IS5 family transposase [Streptomyces sp. NPDC056653]|uniref:IS5 family transposase n=1 Tax=Streptomyces sp. NPDC056653 TaxID=3345894 RepID=UPI0036C92174